MMRSKISPDKTADKDRLVRHARGVGRVSAVVGSVRRAITLTLLGGLLAGCGATLNPELEHGVSTSERNSQLAAGIVAPVGDSIPGVATRSGSSAGLGSSVPGTTGLGASRADGRTALPSTVEGFAGASTPGAASYKIGPNDVLEVSVFKVPELSRTVQVGDAGTVNLPLVNEIVVAGKTPQEFERDLTARLGAKYLQSPQVTVNVREFNSQRITIEGAVKSPGVLPMKGRTTLLQVMAQAGGIDTAVATNEVVVFRVRDGKRYAAKFDVGEIRTGNAEDPQLVAGDVIVVNSSDMKTGFNNFLKVLPLASFLLLL